jgi:hypothetical protein
LPDAVSDRDHKGVEPALALSNRTLPELCSQYSGLPGPNEGARRAVTSTRSSGQRAIAKGVACARATLARGNPSSLHERHRTTSPGLGHKTSLPVFGFRRLVLRLETNFKTVSVNSNCRNKPNDDCKESRNQADRGLKGIARDGLSAIMNVVEQDRGTWRSRR